MMSMSKQPRQQSRHLAAFILLLLAETPMHGGGIQAELNRRLPSLRADSAAVYRALQQLETDQELSSDWDTSGSGPAIRVYQLTAQGWQKLEFWFADVQDRLQNLQYFIDQYAELKPPGSA